MPLKDAWIITSAQLAELPVHGPSLLHRAAAGGHHGQQRQRRPDLHRQQHYRHQGTRTVHRRPDTAEAITTAPEQFSSVILGVVTGRADWAGVDRAQELAFELMTATPEGQPRTDAVPDRLARMAQRKTYGE